MDHKPCEKHFGFLNLFENGFFGPIFLLPNPTSFCYSHFI